MIFVKICSLNDYWLAILRRMEKNSVMLSSPFTFLVEIVLFFLKRQPKKVVFYLNFSPKYAILCLYDDS